MPPTTRSTPIPPPRAVAPVDQPYRYRPSDALEERDWRRLPGYRNVDRRQWLSAHWQRRHAVRNLAGLKDVFGPHLTDDLAESIARDQRERATMSMLVPPHMLNTMDETDLWTDPIRRYMLPAYRDRNPQWPSHPMSRRDSLHEADMWAVEGLTHRYPTKVLAELLSTCPQYCGHCTRMDLVGNSVPQFLKYRFETRQRQRHDAILDYVRSTPSVRDVVVSGGDLANLPVGALEGFVSALMDVGHVRDIRLATKGLMGLPQHFLQDEVLRALERLSRKAQRGGVDLSLHTHINHARSVTPLVAEVVEKLLAMGFRDVRNQGVLLRGVNNSQTALLDLSFVLLDRARIMPYYFYMCDMVPNSEHWRISLDEAQRLQHSMMGYLPGFATARVVCDVPFVGKRWVHQVDAYDRVRGISYWSKNYRTPIEGGDGEVLTRTYEYYDPIHSLPEEGRRYWSERAGKAATA